MIDALFEYKEQHIVIQCYSKDKVADICKKFSTKINDEDYDKKLYIYNKKPLNLDLTLGEQIDLVEVENKHEIIILVYEVANYVKINYNYGGRNSFIIAKDEESFLQKAASKLKKPFGRLLFIFNGGNASKEDSQKSFKDLSNEQNKKDKSMNLVIMDKDDDDDENNEVNQGNQEKKIEIKDENNQENNDENKNKNEEVNKEPKKVFFINEISPFFIKLYLFLIIQFSVILVFCIISFKKDFNEKFINSNKKMISNFVVTTIITSFISGFCFSEDDDRKKNTCTLFILFMAIIIDYCIMLTKYIEETNYIICTLSLFLLDFIVMEIYILIFRKYRGYLFIILCLLFDSIAMIIFYYTLLSKPDKKVIIIISVIAFLKILYTSMFNSETRRNFNDDEIFYALTVFNYILFTPCLLIIIISLLLTGVGIMIGIGLVILGFLLAFFIIMEIISAISCSYD